MSNITENTFSYFVDYILRKYVSVKPETFDVMIYKQSVLIFRVQKMYLRIELIFYSIHRGLEHIRVVLKCEALRAKSQMFFISW